jgi:uncharacterized protein YidB (DUF937 family)
MGLLDSILGAVMGHPTTGTDPQQALFQSALQMVTQHGGITGMQQKFQANNMGNIFSQWVGNGPNPPVTGDQITQVLGHDSVQHAATSAGISHGAAAAGLAALLPIIIDKLTPGGNVPTGNALQSGLSSMLTGGLANLMKEV